MCSADPSPALCPSPGHTAAAQCLFYVEIPKTEYSIRGVDVKEAKECLKEDVDYLRSFRKLRLKGQGDWQSDEDGAEKEDRFECSEASGELILIR